ncbi:MAG: glutamine--fructose-6-phosphate transaminase (isomerizing) [Clostridia bacterium]|nr:glutamine--fructose-6-phosphate transaminase (isomerizing) [Clostridia bacterium]
MCGIVGYVGRRAPLDVLIPGLRRLEYRGYDSAGVGVVTDGRVAVVKKEGPLQRLETALAGSGLADATAAAGGVCTGLGHTRWATHGRPSDENAHPHTNEDGTLAVVHNGIIENDAELRRELQARGHVFRSETDTEVVAHLVEEYYGPGGEASGDLAAAVRLALRRLKGAYAFVIISAREPGRIVVVRQSSPLIIGIGDGETFAASGIPALLPYTRRMIALEDGEMADLRPDRVVITKFDGTPVRHEPFTVDWDEEQAEKGGYRDFMLKEIHEQPEAWENTLRRRLREDGTVDVSDTGLAGVASSGFERIAIVACGTAYHSGVVGKTLFERWARIPVEVDLASEFRYRDPLVGPDTLTIVISQSGETADTLAAMREARERGSKTLAIVNVVGSTIAREADSVFYTHAGPEIAVASTKAYTTQLLALSLLALSFARERGPLDDAHARALGRELLRLPALAREALATEAAVEQYARRLAKHEDVFFIGRGLDYAAAMEAQLKLKEISYIHAEAYAAGELKHGTLALVTDGVPVVAIATQAPLLDKTISNIREVQARGAWVIGVATQGEGLVGGAGVPGAPATAPDGTAAADWAPTQAAVASVAGDVIAVPATHPYLQPALVAIPLQLLAYYAAVALGHNVDKPRNLAKSVTVE